VWSVGGELKTHSNVVVDLYSSVTHPVNFSSLTNESYMTNINQTTPIIEIVEPKELIRFQDAIASGKSE